LAIWDPALRYRLAEASSNRKAGPFAPPSSGESGGEHQAAGAEGNRKAEDVENEPMHFHFPPVCEAAAIWIPSTAFASAT
jgi:hypothetical protein